MNKDIMLKVENLSLSFKDQKVFENLSFTIAKGDKAVLLAPSGKGKSSILHSMLGFVFPQQGKIYVMGKEVTPTNLAFIRTNVAWLPQDFPFTTGVREFFDEIFAYQVNKNKTPDEQKLLDQLCGFDLDPNILLKDMYQLSGGEKQRLGVIASILLERPILLLDEPTSSLDDEVKNKVIDYLFSNKENTILVASHDEKVVEKCNVVIKF